MKNLLFFKMFVKFIQSVRYEIFFKCKISLYWFKYPYNRMLGLPNNDPRIKKDPSKNFYDPPNVFSNTNVTSLYWKFL